MSIYVQDNKTVRHYLTTPKVEKAIETLLKQNEELVYSETHEGYEVSIKEQKESEVDNDNLVNKNQGLVKDLVKESEVQNDTN